MGMPIRDESRKPEASELIQDLRDLIVEARRSVAAAVNCGLTALYWRIGKRVQMNLKDHTGSGYGAEIVASVARGLENEFGSSFSEKNLRHMLKFVEIFSDEENVSALWRQLTWSHFKTLMYVQDPLKRWFYTEMASLEGWSTRILSQKIDGMLFERTAISRKPEQLIHKELATLREQGRLSPDLVFRDPYVLDFLGLEGAYDERDLELAILRELENFMLEMGVGFAFVARQKRMVIDNEDHHLDLLFFHRHLKCLVAVELKMGKFKAGHKGQMELYLRWLEAHEQGPDEGTPLGLILCASGAQEAVELLRLGEAGIRVAEFLTDLPPREVLEMQLHRAVDRAKAALEQRPGGRGLRRPGPRP